MSFPEGEWQSGVESGDRRDINRCRWRAICIWRTAPRAQRHGRIEAQVWGRRSKKFPRATWPPLSRQKFGATGAFPKEQGYVYNPPRRAIWFDLIDPAANQWNTTQMAKNKSTADFMLLRRLLGWGINESFWSFSSAFWESKKFASSRLASSPPHPSPPLPPLLFYLFFMLKNF